MTNWKEWSLLWPELKHTENDNIPKYPGLTYDNKYNEWSKKVFT